MSIRVLRIALAAAGFAAPGVAANAQTPSPDERAIRSARAVSNRAIAAHDTAAMGSVWLPEFHQVVSTNAQSDGRSPSLQFFATLFADRPDVVYVRTPDRIVVNDAWGQAGESGHWRGHWTRKDGVTHVGGEYYAKWKRTEGRW